MRKFLAVCILLLGACSPIAAPAVASSSIRRMPAAAVSGDPSPTKAYNSPYKITYQNSELDLAFDFKSPPRSDIKRQFDPDRPPRTYANWYNRAAYAAGDLSWGPQVVQFPPVTVPDTITGDAKTWRQERILRVAQKYLGTYYQHHHHPDWFPEADANWPWTAVSLGRNSKGIDCSNFSSLVYNYGLGIRLNTYVDEQAEEQEITGPGGNGTIAVQTISPQPYGDLIAALAPGDLLYIAESAAPKSAIFHVVLWIGVNSSSPDVPLVIDSHDNEPPVKDKNRTVIPAGVHIRPFTEDGWYFKAFDHAHRIIE